MANLLRLSACLFVLLSFNVYASLYGLGSSIYGNLYSYDIETGESQFISNTNFNYRSGLAFGSDGLLYGLGSSIYGNLYSYNIETGESQFISNTNYN